MRIVHSLATAGLALGLLILPAAAGSDQEKPEAPIREQIEEAIRELMEQMKPALDRFLGTLEVLGEIDSLQYYEDPEVLPNGDIIIRRRPDAPPLSPEEAKPPVGDERDPAPGVRT